MFLLHISMMAYIRSLQKSSDVLAWLVEVFMLALKKHKVVAFQLGTRVKSFLQACINIPFHSPITRLIPTRP